MAASFPNAKKTFTQAVNGVTKLVAALFNQPYDEIEAIETFIGSMGCTSQSYTESIKNLLIAYRRGCSVDYKGAADLYVRSGEIAIPDASGNVRLRRNTSDTTVDWANLDTGSEAPSTTYYVYAVADAAATTFTVKISTNATTPTGCTFYKQIGTFYNDSSGNIFQESFFNINYLNPPSMKTFISKSADTAYYAYTDGYVIAYTAIDGNTKVLHGFTDSSNPPTTEVMTCPANDASCGSNFMFPVKRGNYWKVTVTVSSPAVTIFWVPYTP